MPRSLEDALQSAHYPAQTSIVREFHKGGQKLIARPTTPEGGVPEIGGLNDGVGLRGGRRKPRTAERVTKVPGANAVGATIDGFAGRVAAQLSRDDRDWHARNADNGEEEIPRVEGRDTFLVTKEGLEGMYVVIVEEGEAGYSQFTTSRGLTPGRVVVRILSGRLAGTVSSVRSVILKKV